MEEKDEVILARAVINMELEKKKLKKEPIAVYDSKTGVTNIIDQDGNIIESIERISKEGYSERIRKES